MNRKDFMGRLEELLMDIPTEERVEAMAFYHSYFEDAGEENEERVIRELESPEKVAASIKAEMGLGTGQDNGADRKKESEAAGKAQTRDYVPSEKGDRKKEDNTFKIVMIVLVAVVTCPFWLALLGALLGLVIGALGAVFGILVAAAAVAFSLYLAGFALIAAAFLAFGGGAAAIGVALLGAGFLVLAFALLGTVACVWIFGVFAPWAVRGIISLCKRLFRKRQKGGYAA